MLADPLGRRVPNRFPLWLGTQVRLRLMVQPWSVRSCWVAFSFNAWLAARVQHQELCCNGVAAMFKHKISRPSPASPAAAILRTWRSTLALTLPTPCPHPPTHPPTRPPSSQFLTNVFFPIYLAQRLRPDSPEEQQQAAAQGAEPPLLPAYAPAVGAVAAAVGAFSLGWAALARPEMAGDLSDRWQYLITLVSTSRVDWAFVVDAGLYGVWQAWLLGACGAAPAYRFVPFFGLAAWLITGPREGQAEQQQRGRH